MGRNLIWKALERLSVPPTEEEPVARRRDCQRAGVQESQVPEVYRQEEHATSTGTGSGTQCIQESE